MLIKVDPHGTSKERIFIANNTDQIYFVSNWVKKKFFEDLPYKHKNNCEILYPAINELKTFPKKKKIIAGRESIVKIRALDKITAKTKHIKIAIGKKKRLGYLEIYPRKCNKFEDQNKKGVAAYIQVRDLSDKKEDKVFVFNGWTFSTSTNLRTFDHPIYDLWVIGCENIK